MKKNKKSFKILIMIVSIIIIIFNLYNMIIHNGMPNLNLILKINVFCVNSLLNAGVLIYIIYDLLGKTKKKNNLLNLVNISFIYNALNGLILFLFMIIDPMKKTIILKTPYVIRNIITILINIVISIYLYQNINKTKKKLNKKLFL